jgi:hypothetical protein
MDKLILENMLNSGESLHLIAKKTQKSLSTIRYWCKKHGLKSQYTNFKIPSQPHNCKVCGETTPSSFSGHKKSLCKKCYNLSLKTKPSNALKYLDVKEWRKNTKLKLFEGFGGKCSNCGIIDDPIIYDMHHLIPSEKQFRLSDKIRKWDSIVNEAKKCAMLCSPCHRKLHAGLIQLTDIITFDESKINPLNLKVKCCPDKTDKLGQYQ